MVFSAGDRAAFSGHDRDSQKHSAMLAPQRPQYVDGAGAVRGLCRSVRAVLFRPHHLYRRRRDARSSGRGADFIHRLPEHFRSFHYPFHAVGGSAGGAVLRAAAAFHPAGVGLLRNCFSTPFLSMFWLGKATQAQSPPHAGRSGACGAGAGRAGGSAGGRDSAERKTDVSGLAAGAYQCYRLYQSGNFAQGSPRYRRLDGRAAHPAGQMEHHG